MMKKNKLLASCLSLAFAALSAFGFAGCEDSSRRPVTATLPPPPAPQQTFPDPSSPAPSAGSSVARSFATPSAAPAARSAAPAAPQRAQGGRDTADRVEQVASQAEAVYQDGLKELVAGHSAL